MCYVPEILTENILPDSGRSFTHEVNVCVNSPEQQFGQQTLLCLKDRMEFYYLKYGSAATKEAA